MNTLRTRAAAAVALAAALTLGTVGAASAAPKPKPVAAPAAHSAAATTVPAQVQLHVAAGTAGQVVATVVVKAPGNAAVTGDYQLVDGGVVVASGTLTAGTAQVALTLTEGTHTLVASYSGAAKVNGAGTKVVIVAPAPVVEPVAGA